MTQGFGQKLITLVPQKHEESSTRSGSDRGDTESYNNNDTDHKGSKSSPSTIFFHSSQPMFMT